VVFDELKSDTGQPYEWYLNPAGRLLENKDAMVFGDEQVKLAVIPVRLSEIKTQIIQKGDSGIPPYYAPLQADFGGPDRIDGPDARWARTSLVIESARAANARFLNILLPFEDTLPCEIKSLGEKGRQLLANDESIIISASDNNDRTLAADNGVGFVQTKKQTPLLFGLFGGTALEMRGEPLLSAKLKSTVWSSRYTLSLDAVVSLADKRASIGLPIHPWERGLVLKHFDGKNGREVAAVEVELTFKVNEKPGRMLLRQSSTEMPSFGAMFKSTERMSLPALARFRDSEPAFSHDAASGMVTVTVPAGISQLIWE
jgi:hypothetical protein